MSQLANYLWEASIVLLVLFAFYKVFLARLTFFSWNRLYLLATIVVALILPLISIQVSTEEVAMDPIFKYSLPEAQLEYAQSTSSAISFHHLLLGLYMLGVAWKLIQLIMSLVHTYQLINKSPVIHENNLRVIVHPDFQPSSFFNYVFLPSYHASDSTQDPVIQHEAVHVQKLHTLDLLLLQLASAILWFHPIWGMFEANLREVHEYEADEAVTATYPKTAYARLLLGFLITESNSALVNNFNHFQTKKRIQMMMKTEKSQSVKKSIFLLIIPLLAAMLLVFACDPKEKSTSEDIEEEVVQVDLENDIFDMVEQAPDFVGGMGEWNNFLASNLNYPPQAKENGIEGTVFIAFVVRKDGKVTDVELLRGIGGGCDEEALRVIQLSPDWIPGKQKGQNVNVKMRLPIKFAINK